MTRTTDSGPLRFSANIHQSAVRIIWITIDGLLTTLRWLWKYFLTSKFQEFAAFLPIQIRMLQLRQISNTSHELMMSRSGNF